MSTVTDMISTGVAYLTTGQKTSHGWTIIKQCHFATAKSMMHFLVAAMASIPPAILLPDLQSLFNVPAMFLEPIKRHLLISALNEATAPQRMNLLQQIVDNRMDVADLSHFK